MNLWILWTVEIVNFVTVFMWISTCSTRLPELSTIYEKADVRQGTAASWSFWLLREYSVPKLSSVFCSGQKYSCQGATPLNVWRSYWNTINLSLTLPRLKRRALLLLMQTFAVSRHILSNKFWQWVNIFLRYSSFLASRDFSYILITEGVSFRLVIAAGEVLKRHP